MIACAQTQPGIAAAPKLETDDQKTLYALGFLLGSNVKPFALTSDQLAIDSLLDGSSTCGLAFTLSYCIFEVPTGAGGDRIGREEISGTYSPAT